MFASLDRVAFYIGNYPVMKYGITLGLAMLISVFLLLKIRKKYFNDISENDVLDFSFLLIVFGIIGARLWFVLLNFSYFSVHLLEIIMINKGGLSIHGAIIAGIITGFVYVKKKNIEFLRFADMIALVLPIGQAIGRFGNFFNSEAYGLPCNLPWKLFIPVEKRPLEFIQFEYFHPTFLYESIFNIIIFLILFFYIRKKYQNVSGVIFFSYLILYSVIRYFIELIRIDSVLNIGVLPIACVMSILFLMASCIGLCKILKK